MKHLVIDLETVTDTDAGLPPPKKKKDGTDAMQPAPYHRVVVMGAALLERDYSLRRIWIVGESRGDGEAAALGALAAFLNECFESSERITVVSFNGRGFDMPVITARCLRHGIAFPWYHQQRDVRYRYSTNGHIDLMDYLIDYGASQFYSLDVATKLIGLPGKMDCKGADVATMVAAGQIEQVRAYCLQDVAQTAALFLRVQLLRGELPPHEYVAAMEGLLAVVAREKRLAPLLPRIDRERLLHVPQVGHVDGAGVDGAPALKEAS